MYIYISYIQILKNQKGNNQTWQETLKDQQNFFMLLLLIVTLLLNLRITALDLRNRELGLRLVPDVCGSLFVPVLHVVCFCTCVVCD